MKTLLFLLIPLMIYGFDKGVSGIVSLGYGTVYNYEESAFKGYEIRANVLRFSNSLLLEADVQGRVINSSLSPLIYAGGGWRVVSSSKAPAVWLTGSWLYSDLLPVESYALNREINSPGFGFVWGMKGDWLKSCFVNFNMSYYPRERALYKSMQLGWEIYHVGFSVGGTGIRVPDGRIYSSFIFSLRYLFGEW